MPLRLPTVYPLTDVRLTGLTHAEQVLRLSAGGASIVQLREKVMPAIEFYTEAKAALRAARDRGIQLIVNDRVDIAIAIGADGVHLGQDDLTPTAVRSLMGLKAIIGVSTHNVSQALQAARLPIDYVAIGPIFPTGTKSDTAPPLGLTGLSEVRGVLGRLPLVAIGGITAANAAQVISAGADCVALISALLADPQSITERTARLIRVLQSPVYNKISLR
jgi:thiamine-phosphate pyrophosphorylase